VTAAKRTGEQAGKQQDSKQTAEEQPLTGVYVATEPLTVDGALAFAPGDIVPAGHVQRFGWRDQVRPFDESED
jgi:hypothetical protein